MAARQDQRTGWSREWVHSVVKAKRAKVRGLHDGKHQKGSDAERSVAAVGARRACESPCEESRWSVRSLHSRSDTSLFVPSGAVVAS